MAKRLIIFGPINKKMILPFLLAFTQIIYIIFTEYYPEKKNDTVVHGIVLSLSQMYIKFFPYILKIDNKEKAMINLAVKKKCFHYFLLGIIFLFDGILVVAAEIIQTSFKGKTETFTISNLFPHNDFVLMSIEMIFLVCVSVCLLKYRYFKHNIISLIIFTIFGIICEAILTNYDDIDWVFILIKFINILEVGVNATYVCYQKYLMEKLYFPYWNVAFVPGAMMLVGLCLLMCPLSILIIYYFTPNFILIIFQLTGITKKLIDIPTEKLYCLIFYIIQFFALMIHLEILELNFCGLNKYTKRNIDLRGIDDIGFEGRDSSVGLDININININIGDEYLLRPATIEMREEDNNILY